MPELKIILDDDTYALLKQAAKINAMPVTTYIRSCAVMAANKSVPKKPAPKSKPAPAPWET